MRNLQLILLAIIALTFIVSCEKDENKSKETLNKETISAKWLVNGSSDYESFEFNESGNYIIVKNTAKKSTSEDAIIFGTYEFIDNKKITLNDFGTLKISEIYSNSISFSLQLSNNPDNEIIIEASKKDEMESTKRTDLLCKTWDLVTLNDTSVAGTDMELKILFSKAGTYYISYVNRNDGELAQWKWKNEAETELLYSWDDEPNWEEVDFVEIPELTSNTLKIIEDETEYVLQPASNKKSARGQESKFLLENIEKRSILKK